MYLTMLLHEIGKTQSSISPYTWRVTGGALRCRCCLTLLHPSQAYAVSSSMLEVNSVVEYAHAPTQRAVIPGKMRCKHISVCGWQAFSRFCGNESGESVMVYMERVAWCVWRECHVFEHVH